VRNVLLVAAVTVAAGCTPIMTRQGMHTLSRGSYDVAEKRVVWGRALESFQERNLIITFADLEAGVLASGNQPEVVRCASINGLCDSTTGVQFTLSEDGTVMFSVRRGVTGAVYSQKPLLPEASQTDFQRRSDDILRFIVGERGKLTERPTASPPGSLSLTQPSAQRRWPKGVRCSKDEQCQEGLACVESRCAKPAKR
jgi:hypothetical protein